MTPQESFSSQQSRDGLHLQPPWWLLRMVLPFWCCLVGVGITALVAYSNKAGEPAVAPSQWPPGAATRPAAGRYTLLLFAHPKCPCSRATIAELARLMSHCKTRLDARVFFYRPENEADAWAMTDLWHSARIIPGVLVAVDPAGRQATAFGARTSGQALLYDPQGRLCFRGGITAGRGHEGDNAGRSAIETLVRDSFRRRLRGEPAACPVFGCAIAGPETCPAGPCAGPASPGLRTAR